MIKLRRSTSLGLFTNKLGNAKVCCFGIGEYVAERTTVKGQSFVVCLDAEKSLFGPHGLLYHNLY